MNIFAISLSGILHSKKFILNDASIITGVLISP